MKKTWWIAALVSAGLVFGACGGDDDDAAVDSSQPDESADLSPTEDPSDDADDPDLDLDPGEVVVEQGGDAITSGAEFPDDFPVWAVKLPDKFALLMVQERDVAGDVGWTVLGTVPREPDLVEFGLLGSYGDADEHTNEGGVIRMRYADANGYEQTFTMEANADGDTALTIAVSEA